MNKKIEINIDDKIKDLGLSPDDIVIIEEFVKLIMRTQDKSAIKSLCVDIFVD